MVLLFKVALAAIQFLAQSHLLAVLVAVKVLTTVEQLVTQAVQVAVLVETT
jgi:hypothetical protein